MAFGVEPRFGFLSVSGFGGETGFDPVLLAALVVCGVLVAYGRQFTDDPRRGMSVEVGAIRDDLCVPVGRESFDLIPALVVNRPR